MDADQMYVGSFCITLIVLPDDIDPRNLPIIGQAVMQTILWLVCSSIFLYIFQKALAFWKATRAIQYAQVPLPITSPNYEVK